MITIEDVLFKLKILKDVVPDIESDNDVQEMIDCLEDVKKFKSETVKRFKNDCVSIFVHKYNLEKKDMIEHMDCLTDEEYLDYIDGEDSTEDYVDEDISNWDR